MVALATGVLMPGGPALSQQQQPGPEGSWSGGGTVTFRSGNSEEARCRATIYKNGGNSYGMNATCATASGKVTQTAELARSGGNRFSGEFFNSQYNVSGIIKLLLNGNRLNATMSGGGASAVLSFSR